MISFPVSRVIDLLIKCLGGIPKHIRGKYVAQALRKEMLDLIPSYRDLVNSHGGGEEQVTFLEALLVSET